MFFWGIAFLTHYIFVSLYNFLIVLFFIIITIISMEVTDRTFTYHKMFKLMVVFAMLLICIATVNRMLYLYIITTSVCLYNFRNF